LLCAWHPLNSCILPVPCLRLLYSCIDPAFLSCALALIGQGASCCTLVSRRWISLLSPCDGLGFIGGPLLSSCGSWLACLVGWHTAGFLLEVSDLLYEEGGERSYCGRWLVCLMGWAALICEDGADLRRRCGRAAIAAAGCPRSRPGCGDDGAGALQSLQPALPVRKGEFRTVLATSGRCC